MDVHSADVVLVFAAARLDSLSPMLGVFGFFYGCLHFLTWLILDKFFDWNEIVRDVAKRPFITAGFTGFILLILLAVASTAGWIRRLGGRR